MARRSCRPTSNGNRYGRRIASAGPPSGAYARINFSEVRNENLMPCHLCPGVSRRRKPRTGRRSGPETVGRQRLARYLAANRRRLCKCRYSATLRISVRIRSPWKMARAVGSRALVSRHQTPRGGWFVARRPSSRRCAAARSRSRKRTAVMGFPKKNCSPGSTPSTRTAFVDCAPPSCCLAVPGAASRSVDELGDSVTNRRGSDGPPGACLAPAGPLNPRVIRPKPYHLLLPFRLCSGICASEASRDHAGIVNWTGDVAVCAAYSG
jgi:hypothetical protein